MQHSFLDTFRRFLRVEQASGVLLIACTILSLLLANSALAEQYHSFWNQRLDLSFAWIHLDESFIGWINDGLMTIFFLVAGLEIKRELLVGELSSPRKAALPFIAALGGMLIPAVLFNCIAREQPEAAGWGIPMATDIAFALGVLSLLGNRIPIGLKVFLTALAVIDDIGAVIVIAAVYSKDLQLYYLLAAALVWFCVWLMNRLKIRKLLVYLLPGLVLWYCLLHSGIHATLSGVLIAMLIPFERIKDYSPLLFLEEKLHGLSAYFIMPLFALANTAILLPADWMYTYSTPVGMAVIVGLLFGKPLGIVGFSWLGRRLGWLHFPQGTSSMRLWGIGFLGGVGFTMSIFITLLAYSDNSLVLQAKVAILSASILAGIIGYGLLAAGKRQ